MIVSPAAPHNCGVSTPDFVAPNVRIGLAGLGMLALLGLRRRRRWVKALVLVGALCVMPMLSGCGSGCKDFGTEPTNYTFTVTATSMGSPTVSLAQVVTLKVHL
jgi:MYXO-CTERM domain-containing protein